MESRESFQGCGQEDGKGLCLAAAAAEKGRRNAVKQARRRAARDRHGAGQKFEREPGCDIIPAV